MSLDQALLFSTALFFSSLDAMPCNMNEDRQHSYLRQLQIVSPIRYPPSWDNVCLLQKHGCFDSIFQITEYIPSRLELILLSKICSLISGLNLLLERPRQCCWQRLYQSRDLEANLTEFPSPICRKMVFRSRGLISCAITTVRK